MRMTEAEKICTAITERALFAMGLCEKVSSLRDVSLGEMLQAVGMVERRNKQRAKRAALKGGGYSTKMVPAERLIAAAFTLEHFDPDDEAVVVAPYRNMFGQPARKAVGIVEFAGAGPDEERSDD